MHACSSALPSVPATCHSDRMKTIALIGDNSMEFARDEVIDLCGMPEIGELELRLHDPNQDRLAHAGVVARAVVRQAGVPVTVRTCRGRRAALDGADYVISELEVGGIAATRLDFEIPSSRGVRQTVGDTIGLGGIFRGLRTIPVVIGIADDLASLCPDAYLLTYTNPMVMSTWAACAATPLRRIFGLCHSVQETHQLMAALVGRDHAELDFLTGGVNHQAFVLRFAGRDGDLYPRLAEVLDRSPELAHPVAVELFRHFGYFSTDHLAEYLPWFMRHDAELERLRISLDEYESTEAETLADLAADEQRVVAGGAFDLARTGTLAPAFIHSVETGAHREIYTSVRNDGLITNLPAEGCVEVPCAVGSGGAEPRPLGPLPPQLAALNRTFLNVAELTVRAVLEGDRRHVYHAALLDPSTAATLATSDIVAVCDKLLDAHRHLLPPGLAG